MRGLPAAAWFVLGLQLLKLYLCWRLPLFGDEAFYWVEAQRPALAYDDVPGLVPWMVGLSSAALGDTALAVRAPGLLGAWIALGLLFRAVGDLAGSDAAWRCLLLASLPPMMAMNGVMMLPDVAVNLAVVTCLIGAQRALCGRQDGRWWLAAGVLLGTLGHYRFALPLAAAGVAAVALPSLHPLLRWRQLWPVGLALVCGLLPMLWHTLAEQGQGLLFQFVERHAFDFQPRLLADPLLQAVVVSPLLYALLLWAGWRARREPGALAVWAGWGLAMVGLLWALGPWLDSERSRLHWPAPAYLALAVPLALAWPRLSVLLRRATLALAVLACLAGSGYLLAVALSPERLAGSRLYPHNFVGAERLADSLSAALQDLDPRAPLVVDNFLLAAQLEHQLTLRGASRPVAVLDHPQNAKHGRQAVLVRLGRSAESLPAEHPPGLLVVEPAALPLRQRAAWLWSLCERFPQASWQGERWFDQGQKRFVLYRLPAQVGQARQCRPPVVGYMDLLDGAALRPGQSVSGWALAGGAGIDALRLRLDGVEIPLRAGLPVPSLPAQLGDTGDPRMPAVGWQASLPRSLPHGHGWLQLEARSAGRDWHPVAAVAVRVQAD